MNRYTVVEARSNMIVVRFGAASFEWTIPMRNENSFIAPGDIVEIAVLKVGDVYDVTVGNVIEFTLPSETK